MAFTQSEFIKDIKKEVLTQRELIRVDILKCLFYINYHLELKTELTQLQSELESSPNPNQQPQPSPQPEPEPVIDLKTMYITEVDKVLEKLTQLIKYENAKITKEIVSSINVKEKIDRTYLRRLETYKKKLLRYKEDQQKYGVLDDITDQTKLLQQCVRFLIIHSKNANLDFIKKLLTVDTDEREVVKDRDYLYIWITFHLLRIVTNFTKIRDNHYKAMYTSDIMDAVSDALEQKYVTTGINDSLNNRITEIENEVKLQLQEFTQSIATNGGKRAIKRTTRRPRRKSGTKRHRLGRFRTSRK
jgi:hypothetical protein